MALYDYTGSTRSIITNGTIRAIRRGRVELSDEEAAKVPGALLSRVEVGVASVSQLGAVAQTPSASPQTAPGRDEATTPVPQPVPSPAAAVAPSETAALAVPRTDAAVRVEEISQALRMRTVPQTITYLAGIPQTELTLARKAEAAGLNRSSVIKIIDQRIAAFTANA